MTDEDEDGRQQEQGEHERFQGLLHSLGWDRPFIVTEPVASARLCARNEQGRRYLGRPPATAMLALM